MFRGRPLTRLASLADLSPHAGRGAGAAPPCTTIAESASLFRKRLHGDGVLHLVGEREADLVEPFGVDRGELAGAEQPRQRAVGDGEHGRMFFGTMKP